MATMDGKGDIIAHDADEEGSAAPERSGKQDQDAAMADAGAPDLTNTNVNSNTDGGSYDDEDGDSDSDLSEESSEDESSEEESSSSDEDGDPEEEAAEPGKSAGLSEYERLRLERIARNQARLGKYNFDPCTISTGTIIY